MHTVCYIHCIYSHVNVHVVHLHNIFSPSCDMYTTRMQEGELLSMAKSISVEKSALSDVTQQLEETRQVAEQRRSQLEAMQG